MGVAVFISAVQGVADYYQHGSVGAKMIAQRISHCRGAAEYKAYVAPVLLEYPETLPEPLLKLMQDPPEELK
jgi:hypothetical protein